MAKNLNIGTMIISFSDGNPREQSNNNIIEKYCYNDNIDQNYCATYGGLYQWAEAVKYLNGATNLVNWNSDPIDNVQGICPNNWHIPSNSEFINMINSLGSSAGASLKAITPYWNGTNSSGFTAMPAGYLYYYDGTFVGVNTYDAIWTASPSYPGPGDPSRSWAWGVNTISSNVGNNYFDKVFGQSVRCLKD